MSRGTRRRPGTWRVIAVGVLALLFAAIVAAAACVAYIVRAALPKVDGDVRVAGLHAPVTILRDARGIPHIRAADAHDLFFAEGYAVAQDRLWQMDLLRRKGEGRLAEIFGPVAVPLDEYFRTLGFAHATALHMNALDPRAREDLQAYCDGVNAVMTSHPLPFEFVLLGYEPDPWSPKASLEVAEVMAQQLDDFWQVPVLRRALIARLGPAAAAALTDRHVPPLEEYIRVATSARPAPVVRPASTGPSFESLAPHAVGASNEIAVGPLRTRGGKPLVSNDTHLNHSIPSPYVVVQLQGGGFDVEGFAVPGIPYVVIGHNRRIAFGVVAAYLTVQDVFDETTTDSPPRRYRSDGRWVAIEERHERIAVKGGDAIDFIVRSTRHGPIVATARGHASALAWTLLTQPSDGAALRDVNLAGDWRSFRRGLSRLVGPSLGFIYADVDGHVGYQATGRVPVRRRGDGSLPVDGSDTHSDWAGTISFDRLPSSLDPRDGFVASSNNWLEAPSAKPALSVYSSEPFRVHRIYDLIRSRKSLDVGALAAVQIDSFDRPAFDLAKAAAAQLRIRGDDLSPVIIKNLDAWDGRMSADSRTATFVAALEREWTQAALKPRLGALAPDFDEYYSELIPLYKALSDERFARRAGIDAGQIRAQLAQAALDVAHRLKADGPSGFDAIAPWGETNAALFDHPLGAVKPLDAMLNLSGVPQAGAHFAVYQTKPHFGPSQRMVADLGDWDRSSMVLSVGESGQWTSAHYADQFPAFIASHVVQTPFSDRAVDAAAVDKLRLLP